ncbi:Hemin uptake protein hemP [Crateriforma conspicua]|nr:Hemin uptake protein hemP [Crateriforma conspicua]
MSMNEPNEQPKRPVSLPLKSDAAGEPCPTKARYGNPSDSDDVCASCSSKPPVPSSGRAALQSHGGNCHVLDFAELAGGCNQVFICLQDEVYTLKRTRNNKLILHK